MENKQEENFAFITFAEAKPPVFKEVNGKPWIMYGEKDEYPRYLLSLFNRSPKHGTIIKQKVKYLTGAGFDTMLSGKRKTIPSEVTTWLSKINEDGESAETLAKKIALDKCIYGGFYLEVIWRRNGTAEIRHADFTKYRSNRDNTTFYYKSDGNFYSTKDKPVEIPAFDINKRKGKQIFFYKDYAPGLDTYPVPEYIQALNYIEADIEIGKHTHTNAKCGFMPSKLINLHNGIPTDEGKREVTRLWEKRFTGADGKTFILNFGLDPAKDPTIQDLGNSDLTNEDYTRVDDLIQTNIFVSHQFHTMLGGIETAGKLGSRDELREISELFQNTWVNENQGSLERVVNLFASLNNISNELKLKRFEAIGFEFSETVIAANMLQSEIRERMGMEPIEQDDFGKAVEKIKLLLPALQAALIPTLEPELLRSLIGLEGAGVVPEPDPKTKFENDLKVFKEYGKPRSEYNIVTSKPVKFSSELEAAEDEIKLAGDTKEVKRLLAEGKTEAEISSILKLPPAKVKEVIKTIPQDAPQTIEIGVKYSYEWKDEIPASERDTPEHPSREFCHAIMEQDKLYSRTEIERMSEILGYSVWDRKGGFWNDDGVIRPECRHTWKSNLVTRKVA